MTRFISWGLISLTPKWRLSFITTIILTLPQHGRVRSTEVTMQMNVCSQYSGQKKFSEFVCLFAFLNARMWKKIWHAFFSLGAITTSSIFFCLMYFFVYICWKLNKIVIATIVIQQTRKIFWVKRHPDSNITGIILIIWIILCVAGCFQAVDVLWLI